MSAFEADLLREVRTLEDVLAFLGDQLDWPTQHVEAEEALFEFTPEELGVARDSVPTLTSLRQLRPLTASQPWGIFFIEFSGRKLPVTALRRLLRAVVQKKRASNDAVRSWQLDDLLFVTATDSGDAVELHLVAFFDEGSGQPEIRSLPWDPDHSPPQHLRRLAQELLPKLEWPDDPEAKDEWRNAWREAFKLPHGVALTSAAQIADKMAGTAHEIRERVIARLEAEDGDGPFYDLLDEIADELVSGLDEARFADMCAQTLVYGALTARIVDPEGFGATPVLAGVPLANEFLTAFFEQVHDEVTALDLGAAGLEALVADLRHTQVEAILDQFGATQSGGDPVIHFYEEFLQKYDPGIRAKVGAFYTPQPVVECIVRLVDQALVDRLGLAGGIADGSTWEQVAERTGFDVPEGVDPTTTFVSVLDPATGTGTFLIEWIRGAKRAFDRSTPGGDWGAHLQQVILPSMHAFELLLAPYAIAHLKVALEVGPDLAAGLAPNIFLTDTLELPGPVHELEGLNPVAREAHRAADMKRHGRPTVIIGNPPYLRVTRDSTGGWVAHKEGERPALMQDWIDLANQTTIFSHVASLYNLYVYFWRWSVWKALEQVSDAPGVVGFITASSWLDGPAFVGLREAARTLCDEIWVLDLGGDNRGTQQDENVFDIETPVAVTILVRSGSGDPETPARVRYRKIEGTRPEKLAALRLTEAPADAEDDWLEVPSEPHLWLRPVVGDDSWTSMPALSDLFPWQQPGAMLNRTWPVAPCPAVLDERWRAFLADESAERRAELYPNPSSGRTISTKVGNLTPLADLGPDATPREHVRYQWRPFDTQWTFRDPRLAALERPALWQSLSDQQVFFATLASEPLGPGPALVAFTAVPDKHVFRGSFGGKDILPLYRDASATQPNVLSGLLDLLAERLGRDVGAEEMAAYTFALLSTPGYQQRFESFLDDKVIRVPLTSDPALWDQAVALGADMIWLHTNGQRRVAGFAGEQLPEMDIEWKRKPTRIPEDSGDFAYDVFGETLSVADGVLTGVPAAVWDFSVSGWPVVRRWLEHRTAKGRGRRSSELDLIRPDGWHEDWSGELVELLSVLSRALELQPAQDDLLERICAGQLIPASELPEVEDKQTKAPTTIRSDEATLQMPVD